MSKREDFIAGAKLAPPRRAPYTFVPLNERVVAGPWGANPDFSRPHPDGLSGEFTVEWTAETPLLVGGIGNQRNDVFSRLPDSRHAIAGASLRGLIRSTFEILSYAQLHLIHDGRFALRDYEAALYREKVTENESLCHKKCQFVNAKTGRNQTVFMPKGAWLKRQIKKDSDTIYWIKPCGWETIPIDDLISALNRQDPDLNLTALDWNCTSLHDRLALLDLLQAKGPIRLGDITPSLGNVRGTIVPGGLIKTEVQRRQDIMARPKNPPPAPKNLKSTEVAFVEPVDDETEWLPLSAEAFAAFDQVQVSDGRRRTDRPPRENWSVLKRRLDDPDIGVVPVFYRGDPKEAAKPKPSPDQFFMTLTRLARLPYRQSVHEVRKHSQKSLHVEQLDMAQTLFGHVPDNIDPSLAGKGQATAWRSRVRFSMAILEDSDNPPTLGPLRAATMKPRASFFPFYLRPKEYSGTHPVDWSNGRATLAGRKRYPARNKHWPQSEMPAPADESGASDEQTSVMTFLDASKDRPLRFRSKIRFTNILPSELGGLIWAITLGQHDGEDRNRRHMLGRAKAFGYGQVLARITQWHRLERLAGGDPPDLETSTKAFEHHVLGELNDQRAFTQLPAIAALLSASNARLGEQLYDHLKYPATHIAGKSAAEQSLAAYQALKKQASCEKPRPSQDGTVRNPDYRAKQPWARNLDPADTASWIRLPDYPDESEIE